ncbi:MAG: hypothetical protein VYB54_04785 [Pseudomonadota bacterium]|nr:hypothetical protein [Pseudomonadota bacterium]
MERIPDIIRAAGGAEAVAVEAGVTVHAVQKWARKGVPDWHWPTLMKLSGVSLEQMFGANQQIRAKGEAA